MQERTHKSWPVFESILVVVAVSLSSASARAATAQPTAATAEMVPFEFSFPKSQFVYDSATGRDPFFPNSTRTLPVAPKPANTATVTKTPGDAAARQPQIVLDRYLNLSLKGITGDSRFALINGQPFGVGETYKLKTTNGVLGVKCLEIRTRSVVVMIDGEKLSKEIFLRPGL